MASPWSNFGLSDSMYMFQLLTKVKYSDERVFHSDLSFAEFFLSFILYSITILLLHVCVFEL